ncbi:MAG: hypothetical protein LBH28_11485 [Oscillospiraceae bacterium]|nr:hypothetical protein [Oscillospiraceae bacterium]
MQHGTVMDVTPCDGDCLGCQFLYRYDICSPENSTYFLDVYVEIVARRRDSISLIGGGCDD